MHTVLVNPPTLFRWRWPDASARATSSYYESLLRHDRMRFPDGSSSLPGEHLGLQSISALMRDQGNSVSIVNGCVELHSSLHQTLEAVTAEKPDLVGFTGITDTFGEIVWLARGLRQRGFDGPIVLGNHHGTLNDGPVLAKHEEIDFVVRGDGELPLTKLVQALAGEIPFAAVPSLTWREGDLLARSAIAAPVRLDTLPHPSRESVGAVLRLGMSVAMFTKRGCPYRCTFCATGQAAEVTSNLRGSAWRRKDPRLASEEFLRLVEDYGLRHITIVDDLFFGRDATSREWAQEFASHLVESGNRATFMIDCRVDSLDEVTIPLLKRAGLVRAFVGVESGSGIVRSALNKEYRSTDVVGALRILSGASIEVILGFVFFTPYDDRLSLLQSAHLLRLLHSKDFALHLQRMRVYPGTKLERDLKDLGLLRGHFPFFKFDFASPEVEILFQEVRMLGEAVASDERIEDLSAAQSEQLFRNFNRAVVGLLAAQDHIPIGWFEAAQVDVWDGVSHCPQSPGCV